MVDYPSAGVPVIAPVVVEKTRPAGMAASVKPATGDIAQDRVPLPPEATGANE
jgi:hypothetical protein